MTSKYPYEPPNILCLTPIFHPNIDYYNFDECDTNICLDLFDEFWNSKFDLRYCVYGLVFLLKEPNLNEPLSPWFDGEMDYNEYQKKVKETMRGAVIENIVFPNFIKDPICINIPEYRSIATARNRLIEIRNNVVVMYRKVVKSIPLVIGIFVIYQYKNCVRKCSSIYVGRDNEQIKFTRHVCKSVFCKPINEGIKIPSTVALLKCCKFTISIQMCNILYLYINVNYSTEKVIYQIRIVCLRIYSLFILIKLIIYFKSFIVSSIYFITYLLLVFLNTIINWKTFIFCLKPCLKLNDNTSIFLMRSLPNNTYFSFLVMISYLTTHDQMGLMLI